MIGKGVIIFFVISVFSFVVGVAHRVLLETKVKDKKASSNYLERLEALEFAYYFIGIVFLAFGLLAIGFKV